MPFFTFLITSSFVRSFLLIQWIPFWKDSLPRLKTHPHYVVHHDHLTLNSIRFNTTTTIFSPSTWFSIQMDFTSSSLDILVSFWMHLLCFSGCFGFYSRHWIGWGYSWCKNLWCGLVIPSVSLPSRGGSWRQTWSCKWIEFKKKTLARLNGNKLLSHYLYNPKSAKIPGYSLVWFPCKVVNIRSTTYRVIWSYLGLLTHSNIITLKEQVLILMGGPIHCSNNTWH